MSSRNHINFNNLYVVALSYNCALQDCFHEYSVAEDLIYSYIFLETLLLAKYTYWSKAETYNLYIYRISVIKYSCKMPPCKRDGLREIIRYGMWYTYTTFQALAWLWFRKYCKIARFICFRNWTVWVRRQISGSERAHTSFLSRTRS